MDAKDILDNMAVMEPSDYARGGAVPTRVGDEYQAALPVLSDDDVHEDYPEKGMLVWSPIIGPESDLDNYENKAVNMFGYNKEQALAMLFWHKHQLGKAVVDLEKFTPVPSEWTETDKVLFQQAFKIQGKKFQLIQKMLPEKSIKSLVQHYYSRERAAMVDKQNKKQSMMREEEKIEEASDYVVVGQNDEGGPGL